MMRKRDKGSASPKSKGVPVAVALPAGLRSLSKVATQSKGLPLQWICSGTRVRLLRSREDEAVSKDLRTNPAPNKISFSLFFSARTGTEKKRKTKLLLSKKER
jgi:hypothetical protein